MQRQSILAFSWLSSSKTALHPGKGDKLFRACAVDCYVVCFTASCNTRSSSGANRSASAQASMECEFTRTVSLRKKSSSSKNLGIFMRYECRPPLQQQKGRLDTAGLRLRQDIHNTYPAPRILSILQLTTRLINSHEGGRVLEEVFFVLYALIGVKSQ